MQTPKMGSKIPNEMEFDEILNFLNQKISYFYHIYDSTHKLEHLKQAQFYEILCDILLKNKLKDDD